MSIIIHADTTIFLQIVRKSGALGVSKALLPYLLMQGEHIAKAIESFVAVREFKTFIVEGVQKVEEFERDN